MIKNIILIGNGSHAKKRIIPSLKRKKINLKKIYTRKHSIFNKSKSDFLKKKNFFYVCTPPNTHDGIIKKLIDNNKHLLCEKPLSLNLDNLIEYEHLAKEKGLTVMGGYIYKFSPSHIKMKEFIEANQSRVTKAYFRIASPGIQSGWQYSKNQGGGVINELFVHMIDLANWYFGPIENIEEIGRKLKKIR